jgi:hypothetical protein
MKHIESAISSALLTMIAFLSPIHGVLLCVGLFIMFDTVMAYWRCKIKNVEWTSKRLRVGLIPKFLAYQTIVILFFIMDKFILFEFTKMFIEVDFLMTKLLSCVLVYIEFKSIDETFKIIKGKSLLKYFKELLKLTNDIKDDMKNKNDDK